MNYQRIYNKIIANAKLRNSAKGGSFIVESHHIIPRHCGGNDLKENKVNLSLREHFVCHVLLAKVYKGTPFYAGMCRAVVAMSKRGAVSSRLYQSIREQHIANLKKQVISDKQKQAISQANTGNKSRTGQQWNEDQHTKIQNTWTPEKRLESAKKSSEQNKGEKNGMFGKPSWNKGMTGGENPDYPKNRKSVSADVLESKRKAMTGQKRTTEQKANLSHARKLWWTNKKQQEILNAS